MDISAPILKYIQCPNTDYAVFINGKWGSGKTFYIKNFLIEEIEKVRFNEQPAKNYKVIYVSLYGINTLKELRHKIFTATFNYDSIITNEKIKTIANYGKRIFGGLTTKVSEFFGVSISQHDLVDIMLKESKHNVYIFDDLERIETETLNEVLGYINSLTEHENIKVVLVADEGELIKKYNDQKVGFSEIKEKLIRFTFEHKPTIAEVFDKSINGYDGDYREYLNSEKGLILDLFARVKCRNIRTLIFIFDVFFEVFHGIQNLKNRIHGFEIKVAEKLLEQKLFFFTTAAIGYKTSGLTHLELLERVDWYTIGQYLKQAQNGNKFFTERGNQEAKDGDIELKEFINKHFSHSDPMFEYDKTIEELILHFKCDEDFSSHLEIEYKKLANINEKEELIYSRRFKELIVQKDEDMLPIVVKVTEYLNKGEYSYDEVYNIFTSWEYYFETMKLDIPEPDLDLFKKSIDIKMGDTPYNSVYEHFISHIRDKSPNQSELADYIIGKNEERRLVDKKTEIASFFALMTDGDCDKMFTRIDYQNFDYEPIFIEEIFSAEMFFKQYSGVSNRARRTILSVLREYRKRTDGHRKEAFQIEKHFFENLTEIIEEHLRRKEELLISDMNAKWLLNFSTDYIEYLNSND